MQIIATSASIFAVAFALITAAGFYVYHKKLKPIDERHKQLIYDVSEETERMV